MEIKRFFYEIPYQVIGRENMKANRWDKVYGSKEIQTRGHEKIFLGLHMCQLSLWIIFLYKGMESKSSSSLSKGFIIG